MIVECARPRTSSSMVVGYERNIRLSGLSAKNAAGIGGGSPNRRFFEYSFVGKMIEPALSSQRAECATSIQPVVIYSIGNSQQYLGPTFH